MSVQVDPIALLAARVANDPEPAWRLVLARVRDSNARDVAASLLPIADALDDARRAASAFKVNATALASKSPAAKGESVDRVDVSNALGVARQVSFSAPRGKFDAHIMPNGGLVLENAKGLMIEVAPGSIRKVLELPTRDANGTAFVAVSLRGEGVANGKSKCTTLCAAFRAKDKLVIEGEGLLGVDDDGEGDRTHASTIFFRALERGCGSSACGTVDPVKVFAGSKGHGHVQATKGFNSGYLFFLKEGVAFGQSPAMYLHFDDLEDLRILRAENAGSSSFDLSMTPENGSPIEFSNISRDELEHVSRYLAKRCISAENGDAAANAAALDASDDDDESDDDDDEDFTGQERGSDDEDEEGEGDDSGDDSGNDDNDNEMDYSCDDSDDVHGEGNATRKRSRAEDDDDDVEPLRAAGARARAIASPAPASNANASDSDSESDDNAFQVVAQ
jgi:structure-specific recognition protein 1